MNVHDLPTPCLIVDGAAFAHNVRTMAAARPGLSLRPHVKAFKSTALARELAAAGHTAFCAATPREIEGMAAAGLGDDLLLANEVLDQAAARLGAVAAAGARVTAAVDSIATVEAAARGGVHEVLVDVMVGMPRCGCEPDAAGAIAELARAAGLEVRGVMGYEGHLMMEPDATKAEKVAAAMEKLHRAHAQVGGDVVSGGGTGTYAVNTWCTEIQAGSYTLMDADYAKLGLPFQQALYVWCEVIAVNSSGWFVLNGGLKAIAMDHGNPAVAGADVWFVSDEHTTAGPAAGVAMPSVGDRMRVTPAHVDPTVAKHVRMYVLDGENVVDDWAVDLAHW